MTTRITVSRGGEEIRALRLAPGVDPAEIGGHAWDTLGAWERGQCEPPLMAVRLTRYIGLAEPPPSVFIAMPVSPPIPFIQVGPGTQCYWQHADGVPCGGRQYHVEAYLSRRRNVESEACEVHLDTGFDAMVTKLEEAAKAEQRRQDGRRRKRLARQRTRESTTAAADADPTST